MVTDIRTIAPKHFFIAALAAASLCWDDASAQCTIDDWSSNVGSIEALGTNTIPPGRHYAGECGLTVAATGSPSYVTRVLAGTESSIASRFYLFPSDFDLGGNTATVYEALDGGAVQVRVSLHHTGAGFELVSTYRSDNQLVTAGKRVPVLNTWQAVTVGWSANAVGGSMSIDIDGQRQLFLGDIDNGNSVVDRVRLGMINSVAASGSLAFDQFEVRRSVAEMPLLPVNELFSISTRAKVGAGGPGSVVGGFIIDGDAEKCVIIRGRGQSINLSAARISDPLLRLFASGSSTPLEINDNWASHPQAALMEATGRQPGHPNDAAIYRCLPPGGYTAQLRGAAGASFGLGIVEVIDADSGKPFLFSLSTRAEVRNASERAVAGFIIEGDEPKMVMIRGRGPSINLDATKLTNPELRLYRGSTEIARNDDWKQALNMTSILASGMAPSFGRESVILTTLEPGAYTVFLQAANTDYGIGVVEVIDMSGGSISSN